MRTRSMPPRASRRRASPISSVATRSFVSRKRRSASSIASHRSSNGVRFHRSQRRQTIQRRPFAVSKATRRPIGSAPRSSFLPSAWWQNRQAEYRGSSGLGCWGSGAGLLPCGARRTSRVCPGRSEGSPHSQHASASRREHHPSVAPDITPPPGAPTGQRRRNWNRAPPFSRIAHRALPSPHAP